MKALCIFGSRDEVEPSDVADFVMSLPDDRLVVTGGARGVDTWAALVAHEVCRCPVACRHTRRDPEFRCLPTRTFWADWKRYGKQAGPIRNAEMVAFCDEGWGFRREGGSRGTDDCANQFVRARKPVTVRTFPRRPPRPLVVVALPLGAH